MEHKKCSYRRGDAAHYAYGGAYVKKMCQVSYSARCPLYESGLRRPPQRKRGRGVRLLCNQRTRTHAQSAQACFASCFNVIRYWAWRGLRVVSWHSCTYLVDTYKSYSRYHARIGCVDKKWLSTGGIADNACLSEIGK